MSYANVRIWFSGVITLALLAGLAGPRCLAQDKEPATGSADEPVAATESEPEPTEQGSPSDDAPDSLEPAVSPAETKPDEQSYALLIASLTIFVLAIFVGFEVITKVPPTLHTPLMSGSNAISGITIVGALIVAGHGLGIDSFVGFLAVVLASVNVVGGFLVTHRMLAMFQKRSGRERR
jgi:H+-translocating NAD(P) transhydrogenase subunit alpha